MHIVLDSSMDDMNYSGFMLIQAEKRRIPANANAEKERHLTEETNRLYPLAGLSFLTLASGPRLSAQYCVYLV